MKLQITLDVLDFEKVEAAIDAIALYGKIDAFLIVKNPIEQ